MKANDRQSFSSAVAILFLIIWCAVILLIGNFTSLGISGWLSFLYVPLCILTVYFCASEYRPVKNDPAASALPVFYSYLLLVLAAGINAAFIFTGARSAAPFVIAADVILYAVYLLYSLFVWGYIGKLAKKTEKVERNTAFTVSASREIGALLAKVDDPELHRALVELKEKIDYSTNSTRQGYNEEALREKIDSLKEAVGNRKSPEKIRSLISEVSALWAERNTIM